MPISTGARTWQWNWTGKPGEFFDAEGLVLICSTHGALYAPDSGECLGGPCLGCGGLEPVAIEERDGAVYLKEGKHG